MGGAIFNHQGELTLLNSTLSANTAVGGQAGPAADAGRGFGGAIFNLNGAVRIDYSTIAYNTADDGGALYNLGYLAEDTGDPDGHTYAARVVAAGSIIRPRPSPRPLPQWSRAVFRTQSMTRATQRST